MLRPSNHPRQGHVENAGNDEGQLDEVVRDLERDWVRDSRLHRIVWTSRQKLEGSTGPRPTASGKGDGNYCLGQGPPQTSRLINLETSLVLDCLVLGSWF